MISLDVTELSTFRSLSNSAIVKAACLLHKAGKDGIYIKLRIRLLSDYSQIYLRNTYTICAQHTAALGGDNEFILRNLALLKTNIPKEPVYSDGITETDPELDDED